MDVQEIRSEGGYTAGVANEQIIATYGDAAMTQKVGLKVVENAKIDASTGNVLETVVTSYTDWSIAQAPMESPPAGRSRLTRPPRPRAQPRSPSAITSTSSETPLSRTRRRKLI